MIKKARRIMQLGLAVGVAGSLGAVGTSVYVGWSLTHPQRQSIQEKPTQYGLDYENITFRSKLDGIELKGWYIPAPNQKGNEKSKTIIFAHGYGDTRSIEHIHALRLAKALHSAGFHILLFDFRNSGESEESVTSVGVFEKFDLLSAIEYAKVVKKSDQIAVLGWSMGAATSILVGSEAPEVNAIIADSSFSDLEDYLESNLHIWSGLPDFPFTSIILSILPVIEGIDLSQASPYRAVANLKEHQSLLLIHSKADQNIPYENSMRIYESVPKKIHSDIWITEKAKHIESYLLYSDEYENKIITFLNAATH